MVSVDALETRRIKSWPTPPQSLPSFELYRTRPMKNVACLSENSCKGEAPHKAIPSQNRIEQSARAVIGLQITSFRCADAGSFTPVPIVFEAATRRKGNPESVQRSATGVLRPVAFAAR